MYVTSQLVEIPKTKKITTEYIEQMLKKLDINPLRWAIVGVDDKMYKVSVANLKE